MTQPVCGSRVRRSAATFALPALAFVLAACGGETAAPWLSDPGVDGHAMFMPLRGTPHDPTGLASTTSCEGCHAGASFREFSCTGCHTAAATDPLHATSLAAGYVPGRVTSADCYGCHPQGAGIAPVAHGLFFPIGTASHPATCQSCHTDPTARDDMTKLACASCHADRAAFRGAWVDPAFAHSRVLDYPRASISSPWCLRCHADSQVDRIRDHGRQRVGGRGDAAGPGDGNHNTHCFTCHTEVPPDPFFGGTASRAARSWAQNWAQASCSSCH